MAWGPLENSITKCAGDGTKITLYLTKTIKAYLIVGFSRGVNFGMQTQLMKMFSLNYFFFTFAIHFFHNLLYTTSALFVPFPSATPFFVFLSSCDSPVPLSCPPSPLCLVHCFVCVGGWGWGGGLMCTVHQPLCLNNENITVKPEWGSWPLSAWCIFAMLACSFVKCLATHLSHGQSDWDIAEDRLFVDLYWV